MTKRKPLRKTCFDREKHRWKCIGENTSGFVYWCTRCGSIGEKDERSIDDKVRIIVREVPEISYTIV